MSLVSLLLMLALFPTEQEVDRIRFKNGLVKSGLIVEETAEQISIVMFSTGAKGETAGRARLSFPMSDVVAIERMGDEARARALARLGEFEGRRKLLDDALDEIRVSPTKMGRVPALKTVGPNFEVRSTCDEDFLKLATFCLRESFRGYRRFFGVKRNPGVKIEVCLLSNRDEYRKFQEHLRGSAVENPAFYIPSANVIVAYNMVEKEKARALNREIAKAVKEIDALKNSASKQKRDLDKQYRKLKKRLQGEVADARRKIKRSNAANKKELLKDISRQEKEIKADLKKQKKKIDKQIADYRRECDSVIEINRRAIRTNRNTLRQQNLQMFEILFHESFHAFAANFLYPSGGTVEMPRWLNEGMAMYFEMSVVEGGELIHGGLHQDHLKTLKAKIEMRQHLPLRQVLLGGGDDFVVHHESEVDRSDLFYVESWALVHFLIQSLDQAQFDRYVDQVHDGTPKDKALEALLGKSVERLEKDWITYVKSL